ncbi:MAG: DeoR/GlpR transcriptional regulator [Gammaproteobacteria bacterium]|nr:DeoR/GlpR transcriptional regulator [Gammaproteobacteria bacterium]MCP4978922.1 DeoR/GlpR transcriptional regulator [Gammaproteobacteria bacterium]
MSVDISRRQHLIMDYIREHGSVQVDQLSNHLRVTPQTIRRDLNQLYEHQLVQRVHGGAIVKDNVENLGYRARKILMAEEKSDIAQRVADLLPDNSSLFINIGTTTERVAEYLYHRKGMLVITNNMNVASMLWPAPGLEVMITGGAIRRSDGGIVGPSAEEFIDNFKLDYAIIGCSAIDNDGDFFDFDLREVRVTRAIIEHARSVILVTDSMKFERRAPIRIGNIEAVGTLVTDDGVPKDVIQLCEEHGVGLEIVAHERPEEQAGRA